MSGMIGPGKYDGEATLVRIRTNATAVIIVVVDGNKGSGFSIQAPLEFTRELPQILRGLASDVEKMLPQEN